MTPEKRRENHLRYKKENPLAYRWSKRKVRARERGLIFALSKVEFISVVTQNCHYCGIPNAGGIDRKDSDVGYLLINCLPCCYSCNVFKMRLPYEEFIEKCRRISENLKEHY